MAGYVLRDNVVCSIDGPAHWWGTTECDWGRVHSTNPVGGGVGHRGDDVCGHCEDSERWIEATRKVLMTTVKNINI